MVTHKTIRWVGIFMFGAVAIGSLGERSLAVVPACIALCLLIPAIDNRLSQLAKQKGFTAYSKPWFRATVLVILFFMVGATLPKSQAKPEDTTNKTQQKPTENAANNSESNPTVTPSPAYNIPDLLNKNVDELQAVLGKPKDGSVPTKAQAELVTSWDMTFEKDGIMLDVSYNIKSKAVEYLFLDGSDKKTLLTQGTLNEKSKDYILKFVNAINDKNKLLGVKIAKRLPDDLDAGITTSLEGITVTNKEVQDWLSCEIKVNDRKYSYDKIWGVQAGDSKTISFADLTTSDGSRFNIFGTKPKDVYLRCNNAVQEGRWGYFTF